ncbi:alpha/beta hydrolase family protein [Ferrimonas lipolytica]|uniref:S9 family peptidase n=1 Tax=Ferrimonas lipolytica TaxID=2724191 RepID=A0A6H1UDZ4_9GAMM|nr:prolyl oligopeptidase family serine peptidase [Ferrimonas lipolytica]QIZ77048.1 S9 family peptidase [Ferrimonas lipolytica]
MIWIAALGLATSVAAKPVTPDVVMNFASLKDPIISANGQTIAYVAQPDRGDPQGKLQRLGGNLFTLAGASKPMLSADGQFGLFELGPDLLTRENSKPKALKKLKSDRLLVDSQTGNKIRFERVKQAWFSHDGKVLVVLHEQPETVDKDKSNDGVQANAKQGSALTVRDLTTGSSRVISQVWQVAVAEDKFGIAYSTRSEDNSNNGIFKLTADLKSETIVQQAGFVSGALTFTDDAELLGFTWGKAEQAKRQRTHKVGLYQFDEDLRWQELNHADFIVSGYSELSFSDDNQRLFIGRQARRPEFSKAADYADNTALQDMQQLQRKSGLVLWHGDDSAIKTREQHQFKDEFKRQYFGVWQLQSDDFVQLADPQLAELKISENKRYVLGWSDKLYQQMVSWAGFYRDWYLVDMTNGERRLLVTQSLAADEPTLAADDSAVAWYVRGQLYWHNVARNHTNKVADGFANEDHDYPSPAPSYGFGPWLSGNNGVVVYDKYDAYQLKGGDLIPLTQGRERQTIHRVVIEDEEQQWHDVSQPLVLHSVSELNRNESLLRLVLATKTITPWQQHPAMIRFVAKAKQSEQALYRIERYDQFPDLHLANGNFGNLEQVTFMGEQLTDLDWGQAKLVNWRDNNGKSLQGVVITPPGWDGNTPLPTVIYFYRFMSDRLHRFPQMAFNHRPNFPWFSSQGYAIFLPDIRFEVGHPGRSTADALLPGVDHLVQLGITDRAKVGLQGHSWAGYQSAQLVTQTDAFAGVITGAPVANMTSAYTGIRLGSGLGRQFQYEAGQSRIGQSLYRAPELYIENSPVFHTEKVNTPMVIMFGDKDDAVPWQQGIELYLAMRRLSKPVVMLQYQDEPHHLKKYPNKLDYSIKMMEFFDHTLKGKAAPQWWLNGQPWRQPDPKE